jgi:outer membrane protein OmpA-like peptidoglycan-associated protein
MPRGHYTYDKAAALQNAATSAPKLSQDQYEAVLEVYQAQNALQIAGAAGAAEYASDTLAKAQQLLEEAQRLQSRKAASNNVVTVARRAAQAAEDARLIAEKRKQDAEVEQARARAAAAEQQRAEAQAALQQAQTDAAAQARVEQERARQDADRSSLPATAPAAPVAQPFAQNPVAEPQRAPARPEASEVRQRLLRQLNAVLETRDTPRGLVVTVPDSYFHSTSLTPAVYSKLAAIAAIVRGQPGLTVAVEGHTDSKGDTAYNERMSYQRAASIRDILSRQGVDRNALSARGWGNARPLASNATASGREQNKRVEITISGPAIGETATWERSYSLVPNK